MQFVNVFIKFTVFSAILVFALGFISTNADTKQDLLIPFTEVDADEFTNEVDYTELTCMSQNIYHESKNQSKLGMIAVARVVINRVQDNRWPNTVCGVIKQGPVRESWKTRQTEDPNDAVFYPVKNRCQFSWYCDGKADDIPSMKNNLAWNLAQDIAWEVLKYDRYSGIVEGATHYHADYVNPTWSKTIPLITKIDDHIFYRWD